jgi:hypothetical protein
VLEEVREGVIASGILPSGPGASTRGNGSDNGWASDRGPFDYKKVRFLSGRGETAPQIVCAGQMVIDPR